MRWFQATAKAVANPNPQKGVGRARPDLPGDSLWKLGRADPYERSPLPDHRHGRVVGAIMPAISAAIQSAAPTVQTQAADRIYNVNIPLGGGILSQITNVVSELHNMESAIDSVLNEVPGWHLTADIDKTPTFSGHVTGSIDEAANGMLKSASLSLSVSADASAPSKAIAASAFSTSALASRRNSMRT